MQEMQHQPRILRHRAGDVADADDRRQDLGAGAERRHDDVAADFQRLRAWCGADRCGRARRASAAASSADRREGRARRARASPRRSRRSSSARNPFAAAPRAPRRSASRRSRSRASCRPVRGSGPSASRARVSPAFSFSFSPGFGGATGESMAIIFSISPRCRQKSSNAAWKSVAVLALLHEDGMERPVEIVARADAGGLHRADRIDHRGGADRQPGLSERAREDRRCCRRCARRLRAMRRFVHGPLHLSSRTARLRRLSGTHEHRRAG